jgi:hypothetical protein
MAPLGSSILKNGRGVESIQIWIGHKVPEYWRSFFPSASEQDWIAVVAPSAILAFGAHLLTHGYRMGIDVSSHVLPDGTRMFLGPIKEAPVADDADVGA